MATTGVQRFAASLADLDVSMTRTDPSNAAAAIDEVVVEPAVGASLGLDDSSLADTVVETELTPRRLQEAETGVTRADRAIAVYGSLLIQSDAAGTEPVSLYPPNHVAVVHEDDVIDDIEGSVDRLDEIFSAGGSAVFATGASSTGRSSTRRQRHLVYRTVGRGVRGGSGPPDRTHRARRLLRLRIGR